MRREQVEALALDEKLEWLRCSLEVSAARLRDVSASLCESGKTRAPAPGLRVQRVVQRARLTSEKICRAVQKQSDMSRTQMSEVLSDLRKQLRELDAKTDEIKRKAWARENPARRDSGQWEELPADADLPKPGAFRKDAEGPHLHPAVQEKIQALQLDQSEALRFQLDYLHDLNCALVKAAADKQHVIERQEAEIQRLHEQAEKYERILDLGAERLRFTEEQRDASLLLVRRVIAEGKQLELKRQRLLQLLLDDAVPHDHKQAMRRVVLGGNLEEATKLVRLVERSLSTCTRDEEGEQSALDASKACDHAAPEDSVAEFFSVWDTVKEQNSHTRGQCEPGNSGVLGTQFSSHTCAVAGPEDAETDSRSIQDTVNQEEGHTQGHSEPGDRGVLGTQCFTASDAQEAHASPAVLPACNTTALTPYPTPESAPANNYPSAEKTFAAQRSLQFMNAIDAPNSPQLTEDAYGAPGVVVRAGMKSATRAAPKSVLAPAITTPSTVSPSSQRSESSPVCVEESGDGHVGPILPREEVSIELGLLRELPQDHDEFVHSSNKIGPADSLCLDTENGSDTACKTAQIDSFQTSSTDTATSSGELTRIDIFLKEAKSQLQRRMNDLKLELSKATTLEDSFTTYQRCMKSVQLEIDHDITEARAGR